MHKRLGILVLGVIAVFSTETDFTAHAQVNGSALPAPLPANVPDPGGALSNPPAGFKALPAPPAGFDALHATAEERQKYGVPPAPDPVKAPSAFARWQKAVEIPLKQPAPYASAPVLKATQRAHGPAKGLSSFTSSSNSTNSSSNGILTGTSNNWSGPAVYNALAPFKTEAIVGIFVVPTAHQALGTCTGGWTYSSQWPGIDGFNSNDVLQAGIEVDAYCAGGTTSSFYAAWIEWYPYNEVRVSAPVIKPGDMVLIEVWNVSPTSGYAYFYNYSTGNAASYALTAPSGTTLVGNSTEWVVERPGVNGSLATLTNYVDVAMSIGYAWNYTSASPTYYWPGWNPPAGNLYLLSMLDNSKGVISTPTIETFDFIWFQNSGSSYGPAKLNSSSTSQSSNSPY